ncbi:hypothetical protein F7725_003335 [Dissostichus mawsoni]|uniref:G-protein coupled receptors family 2 profile 1 domain-containing protein n=1 Tax=Dissostichus mawsoni TaxID=36200 RepID=A0A7J5YCH8_DISMA|nr:hypothetical protein F7725_003335 [Dissostichus mawsoni]
MDKLKESWKLYMDECERNNSRDPPSTGLVCNRLFDNYACWPDGLPNTTVSVMCPWYLPWHNKVHHGMVYQECDASGQWATMKNTSECDSNDPSLKRLISALYNKMSDLRCLSTDKLRAALETDTGLPLPADKWNAILKLVNSTSLCARHCLIQFKVVHRANISKVKLSKMYPDVSPYCDKCQINEASLIHITGPVPA